MQFAFTEEQEAFRESARRLLAKHASAESVRAVMETKRGYDPALWTRVCEEQGWAALAIPEAYDGFGFGMVAHVALMEQAGAALLCSPLLGSISFAANVLLASGDDAMCKAWLPEVAAGTCVASVVLAGKRGGWDASAITLTAEPTEDGWMVDGEAHHVLDGATADMYLVFAKHGDDLKLFAIPTDMPGIVPVATPTMDQTRRRASIVFDSIRVNADEEVETDVARTLRRAVALAAVALAAEQVGGAQRCLDEAVEYAKVREQFGRPIGSFQAIKHMCADMMMLVESARSAAYYAAWAADDASDEEFYDAAACAASYCAEAYYACAGQSIQIHGGVGFTWEVDAHLHFKRATSGKSLFGTPQAWRAAIAQELLG